MEIAVNSIIKYHNKIIQIIDHTNEAFIGRPYFLDNQTGNIKFVIPKNIIEKIKISKIASETETQTQLNNIAQNKVNKDSEYFEQIGDAHERFSLEQAIETIKVLIDEKIKDKLNFNQYKNSKLKYLLTMVSKEISVALKIDLSEAQNLLNQKIMLRENI